MSSPEVIIYTLLNAAAPVTDLLQARLYAGSRPEGDLLPAAVHDVISDLQIGPRRVAAAAASRPWRARIQLTCFGATPEDAKALAEAAIAACQGQPGTVAGIVVEDIEAQRGPDSFDQEVQTYAQPVDFIIVYQRASA